jgi:Mg-chelatase subunit ChlI
LRLLLDIKKSVPWFVHLPKAIALGISRWVRSTLQTIGDGINNITNASIRFSSALVRALTITAVITLALVAFALVVNVLVSAYREHQLKVELRRQREEYERREQERIRRQEEERRREREGEYERQRKSKRDENEKSITDESKMSKRDEDSKMNKNNSGARKPNTEHTMNGASGAKIFSRILKLGLSFQILHSGLAQLDAESLKD